MTSTDRLMSQELKQRLVIATGAGMLILIGTALLSPARAWANLFLTTYYLVTLGLGGALFLALTAVCGAGWSAAFRRVPEAMTGLLPIAGLCLLGAVALRLPQYGWHAHGDRDPGTFWFKQLWLQPTFLAVRAVLYVALWVVTARLLVGTSRDRKTPEGLPHSSGPLTSILFLFTFAVTISLAGIDWIMALEPLWFSTMWGVYQFSGLIMATLAAMMIACIVLRRLGPLNGIFRTEHLHDLAKLLIGFSCFWMYIWFSQYMLIWYSNIPEETSYFVLRTHGAWAPIVVGSIVLNWVVPFFALLPRPCKRNEGVMLKVAVIVLIGRWVDLSVMVFPPTVEPGPVLGLPEFGGMLCIFGPAVLLFCKAFENRRSVPLSDPFLEESLRYHN